jgi:uncharacterized membrane protein HdeD (DUF308 family)
VRFHLGRPIVEGRLSRIWWVVAIRAIAAIAFGAATLIWTRHAAFALVGLFAAFALLDGATALVAAARTKSHTRSWLVLAGGSSVAAGLFAFGAPKRAAVILIGVLGIWIVVRGASELLVGLTLRQEAGQPFSWRERGCVALNGVMSVAFGIGLIAAPRIGLLSLVLGLGTWAILHGLLMFGWALQMRGRSAPA